MSWRLGLHSNIKIQRQGKRSFLSVSGLSNRSGSVAQRVFLPTEKHSAFATLISGSLSWKGPDSDLPFPIHLLNQTWLTFNYGIKNVSVFRYRPTDPREQPFSKPIPRGRLILSPYARIRRTYEGLALEKEDSPGYFLLDHPKALEWLAPLGAEGIRISKSSRSKTAQNQFFRALAQSGFLQAQSAKSETFPFWNFHDYSFHAQTRISKVPKGGTYPFVGKLKTPKRVHPAYQGKWISLESSRQLKVLRTTRRQSLRGHAKIPLTLNDVGDLLLPFSKRRYPSAGAIYENGLYLAIGFCRDLPPALYQYSFRRHALRKVRHSEKKVQTLLRDASLSWGAIHGQPHAVIIITSNFPLLAWKYETIAYRLTMLNAGVILGRLDLESNHLGLAGCVLGNGDALAFEAASGLSRFTETSIAEFAIGRKK
jgi:oxazoline/thiazoline dehydrogenase